MCLRFGGTLVCVGLPEGDMVSFLLHDVNRADYYQVPIATAFPSLITAMELRIVGSAVGNRMEAIETLDMAARGLIKTHFETTTMDQVRITHSSEKLFDMIANSCKASLSAWRRARSKDELCWICRSEQRIM